MKLMISNSSGDGGYFKVVAGSTVAHRCHWLKMANSRRQSGRLDLQRYC